jgi:hypothetical protein
MFRAFACTVLAAAVFTLTLLAKEYKGEVSKIDSTAKTITVKVDGADKVFSFSDDTAFARGKKALDAAGLAKVAEAVAKKPAEATIESAEKDGKEVVKDGNAVAAKVTFKGKK